MRLAIAGAGVFGLATGLRAAAAGASVQVWDPAPLGENASGVAAGMIAPVGEILFACAGADRLNLLRTGRDGWSELTALAPGLSLHRSGAIFLFEDERTREAARLQLAAVGAEASFHIASPKSSGLFSPEDWRIDAPFALHALRSAIVAAGGTFRPEPFDAECHDAFDAVVVAAGMEAKAFSRLAPELEDLSPIKGQLARSGAGVAAGPVIRAKDLYIVPQPAGVLVGGSMEPGRNDCVVEQAVIETLVARAIERLPALADHDFTGLAGVRASTPDGLPMAGPSSRAGVFIATGARRNGWLLAPLVSEIVVSYLGGGDGGPFAAVLDPRRFLRA